MIGAPATSCEEPTGSRKTAWRTLPSGPTPTTTFPGMGARFAWLGKGRSRILITSGGRVDVGPRDRVGVWYHSICPGGVTRSTLWSARVIPCSGPCTEARQPRRRVAGTRVHLQEGEQI